MSLEQFRTINFRADSLARIEEINVILGEYDGQRLTARQVYYRLVAGGKIPNTPTSYKNLTSLLADARYAGLVDWDLIEDRGREPDVPSEWDSIDEIVDAAVRQFRLPRWRDQPHYVELWVEKQALAGVLGPIARRHHIALMVNKGYSSASAVKASAERMINASPEESSIVLYLGDHDPSGNDMVRDVRVRLEEFGVPDLEVRKLALTRAQIDKFNPPPNPAKITDSRAAAYIAEHGEFSWELDALPPRELNRLVEQAIASIVDADKMQAVLAREQRAKDSVQAMLIAVKAAEDARAKAKTTKRGGKPRKAK
ncbi:MAG TPA: hypothetical protein VJZ73_13375 [Methylomirabilota bacterium]|nr:hypothetical protein [Methylomirabilota bacterium]